MSRAAELVRAARRVLVACHAAPDGDAAGSMLATAAILRRAGKTVRAYCRDAMPPHLRFLPGAAEVLLAVDPASRYDLTIVHDCADRRLLGEGFPAPAVTGPVLVLDHHATYTPFGDAELRDASAAATGVLVARLAAELGVGIDRDAGTALYCSLVSDTGGFRYSNTDAETLRLAAACLDAGASAYEVCRPLFEERPRERFALLAALDRTLELSPDGRVATAVCTRTTLAGVGRDPLALDGVVEELRGIRGVEAAALVTEDHAGRARVSLRGKGRVDLGAIARGLGGGGHRNAAGASPPLAPEEARREVTLRLEAALAGTAP